MKSITLTKLKKVVALLSVFALLLVCMPVSFAVEAELVTIYHETFAGGVGAAVKGGGPNIEAVSGKTFTGNEDGYALYVSNRTNNWDGVDFKFVDTGLENGKTYTITIKGYVDANAVVPAGAQAFLQNINSYGWIAGANFEAGEEFTLTGNYTVNTSSDSALRVQSNDEGKTVPFYIGDIIIKGQPVEVYHESFASGVGFAAQSGGASLTAVDKAFDGNADGKALYISNRANNWDAADFKFTDIGLKEGKTYAITVKGYVDTGVTVPEGGQAFLQTVDSYSWLAGADFVANTAFTLAGSYTVDTSKDSALRVQSNDAGAVVPFYIGEIIITGEPLSVNDGEEEEPEGPVNKYEVYHETFASGAGKAVKSGDAVLAGTDKAFTGYDDGKALYVSNRTNDYDAADFKISDLGLENGKTYTITVKGFVDADVEVPDGGQAYLQAVSSYSWLAGADFAAGSAFTLTGTYTADTSNDTAIRVQSNGAGKTVPFYIGDILITCGDDEVYHEAFAAGKGIAAQSGSASLTAVDKAFTGYDDGKALYVSGRKNSWDAADFPFSDVNMVNGRKYNITVKGYVDSEVVSTTPGAKLFIKTNTNYTELANVNVTTGAAFTLSCEYTVNTSDNDTAFRVQSNDEGAEIPFYIGDVSIARIPVPAVPFTAVTFEDQANGGFAGRAGTETVEVTNEANHTEGGSYALKVTGRTDAWHGPSLNVEKYIDEGSEYKITAWVKLIDPASSQLQLSTQVANGDGASYNNLQGKTVSVGDGWVKYEGTFRYNNMSSDYATIYVESSNNKTASYYIDDISFVPTGAEAVDIQRDLTPIKDVYTNDFLIGNAISAEDLSGVRLELLKMHHNVATAGNAMKPQYLQPSKGSFSFAAADAIVDKVLSEGMKMHGHTLVWHSQSPDWMNKNGEGGYLGREEALENLRTHVKTVVEHFGDKVISWDVVNEAMNDNPSNPSDWKASLRQSPWYYAVGSDYIEQAFLAAREVLDAHPDWDIKLYYNDYNDDNQNKATAIYNMVKEINDRYAETHPGKKLIDGVGMQAHYNLSTNPENVKLSLERFISLGVEVSVTELDIMAGSNKQMSEDQAKAQAYLYAQLFKIYKEHSANIARVTVWGMDDATSWRTDNNPLLFDKNLQAKSAYYAAIDPVNYMAENPPEAPAEVKQASAKYGTPVIDGDIDSVWGTAVALPVNQYQMAWQGATGTAKALWDDSNLYVLVQVNDSQLNKTNANAWEQDSVEVFVDENNEKTSSYQDDDGQYRVNFDNETSFNPAGIATGFASAAKTTGTNYVVEMKIPFKKVSPANNKKVGFDTQINDAKDGSRISAATWNDLTGNGYQDTSVYGELTLTGKGSGSDTVSDNDSGSSQNDIPVIVDNKAGQVEVSANVPVVKNSDGSTTANVSSSYIDAMLKRTSELMKSGADQENNTLRLVLDTTSDDVTAKLPGKAIDKILSADPNASLELAAGKCELKFDSKALEAISKAGTGATEISVSRLDAAKVAAISPEAAKKIADHPVYKFEVKNGNAAVTDFGGGTLTTSIPYKLAAGEDPNAVLVYYIDSNNNLIPVISQYKNGTVVFKTPHLSVYAVGYNKVSFTDVKATDYYYKPVTYLAAREVITGSSFEPKRDISRGEAIVMVMKAYGIKPLENAKDNFSDASGEYAGYYAQAKALGLSKGIGNNKIGADLPLTREMLFTMVSNMESVIGEFPTTGAGIGKLSSFSDNGQLSSWSVDAVSKLVNKGIVIGSGSNTLRPKANAARAEMAAMLYRLLKQ